MNANAITMALVAVFIAWALFRRFRRLFKRQRVEPKRMQVRIGLLIVAAAWFLQRSWREGDLGVTVLGLGAGIALAVLAVRLTTFERNDEGDFFTPHGGIGIALSALLLGRLAYRFWLLYPQIQAAHEAGITPLGDIGHNTLTTVTITLVIAYYASYGIGVLRHVSDRARRTAVDVAGRG